MTLDDDSCGCEGGPAEQSEEGTRDPLLPHDGRSLGGALTEQRRGDGGDIERA
ncbi:Uncharacterised protein [Mycobacteroides abscessus subsp. abscessus]|nr:Uncharacterised protein [Mycobacteroides abscessus subsp. abscessus]